MKYPKEWPGFVLTRSTSEHWRAGQLIELMGVDYDGTPMPQLGDIAVRHLCAFPHTGWITKNSFKDIRPLTPAAREMLAIAKASR